VRTASTAVELAARFGIQMPIAEAIEAVVDGKATPLDAYRGLLRRPPGHEHDPE
jgi:glycerol-3-phosphate dehydrogenase (NAD(P)+)